MEQQIEETAEVVFETLRQAMDADDTVALIDESQLISSFTLSDLGRVVLTVIAVGVATGVVVVYGASLFF